MFFTLKGGCFQYFFFYLFLYHIAPLTAVAEKKGPLWYLQTTRRPTSIPTPSPTRTQGLFRKARLPIMSTMRVLWEPQPGNLIL